VSTAALTRGAAPRPTDVGVRRKARQQERIRGRAPRSQLQAALKSATGLALGAGAGQRAGMVLAVAGLALAVTVPATSAAGQTAGNPLDSAQVSQITAAPEQELSFPRPAVSSSLDADGNLHKVLQVTAGKVSPEAAKGTLLAPLDTLTSSSPFGTRINPLTGAAGEVHTGQDYAVACGTDVHAAAGGTVTFSAWHEYGGGNRIVLDHGNGLSTTYNHLSVLGAKVGQTLKRGEVLAQSGTTGASTGCHLHFEVMVDGTTVDPLGWL
jgi:murein DD-endopeptidase MepM/ murein hydrolase activator NlpD